MEQSNDTMVQVKHYLKSPFSQLKSMVKVLAIPPFWASSKNALLRVNTKPPVELVVADLEGQSKMIKLK